jgi:hypothetical protein
MNPVQRYLTRCVLSGVAAANAILLAALPGLDADDLTKAGLIGLGTSLAYAGIGAASQNVEPKVGNKL